MDSASLTEQVATHLDLTASDSTKRQFESVCMLPVQAVGGAEYSEIHVNTSMRTLDFATTHMVLMYILAKSTVAWKRKKGAFALSWERCVAFLYRVTSKKGNFPNPVSRKKLMSRAFLLVGSKLTVQTIPEQRLSHRTPKNQNKNMIGELIEESGPVPEAAASCKSVYSKGVTRSTHHEKENKNCDRRLPGDTT
ncbi:hypothetical protein EDD15DRAFT_2190468 [Pisolithus albus]|nr:hypothetical protein EDD15DRAFT_2190468 [Pisolithus albus]